RRPLRSRHKNRPQSPAHRAPTGPAAARRPLRSRHKNQPQSPAHRATRHSPRCKREPSPVPRPIAAARASAEAGELREWPAAVAVGLALAPGAGVLASAPVAGVLVAAAEDVVAVEADA